MSTDESSENKLEEFYYYADRRHETQGTAHRVEQMPEWRMAERLKTVSVSLVLCLNIGVDPPDIFKTNPCAAMECWIDPFSMPSQKALESIGRNLQQQYELWQPRARYRLSLDPSIEETKKLCCSLRRNAKEERILFHYNGHGVPKPTPGGELWVFNKNYTQYIPVSIYDIQTWLGSPCIFVYDCSNAGNILNAFNKFAEQRDAEMAKQQKHDDLGRSIPPVGPPYTPLSNCIQIAACRANEVLPMNPDLPADLLTCCLTTPIEIALRWIVLNNKLIRNVTPDMILKIPGKLNDRRTPLGELNWIFTAITDTIAWNVLPSESFQKLFRQDLMVAALFRNFLLADRLMRHYSCHPISSPALPSTHQHPMWDAWDLAADFCLSQLPQLLADRTAEYKHSTFFAEQLSAFEVWLKKGCITNELPQQLPIVLQVLLSQVHRLRALILLSKFLDLGQRAVNLSLSVGIFPYVLKLLQSPAAELRPVLVFIWAKLLAVDSSCQNDLLKDNGYTYFILILSMPDSGLGAIANPSEHRAMCAFVLSVFCRDFLAGQQACLKNGILQAQTPYLKDADPLLRQWTCICLSQFYGGYPEGKWAAIEAGVDAQIIKLLEDPVAEVRTAALSALAALLGDPDKTDRGWQIQHSVIIKLLKLIADASPMVRRELVVALSIHIHEHQNKYVLTAIELMEEERVQASATLDERRLRRGELGVPAMTLSDRLKFAESKTPVQKSLYNIVWKAMLTLSVDPYISVARLASSVVDKVIFRVLSAGAVDHATAHNNRVGLDRTGSSGNLQHVAQLQAHNQQTAQSPSGSHANLAPFRMSPLPSTNNPEALPTDAIIQAIPQPVHVSQPKQVRKSTSFISSLLNIANFVGIASSDENVAGSHSGSARQSHTDAIQRPRSMINLSPPKVPASRKLDRETSIRAPDFAEFETISLKSEFYAWSSEYFREPQMAVLKITRPQK